MALVKGYLVDVDATSAGGAVGDRLDFQFNPETLTMKFSGGWAMHPAIGASHPRPQATGGGSELLPVMLELERDGGGATYVRDRVKWLRSLMLPTYDSGGNLTAGPHRVLFVFGSLIFTGPSPGALCFIRDIDVEFSAFDEDLNPRHAEAKLSLERFVTRSIDHRTVRP